MSRSPVWFLAGLIAIGPFVDVPQVGAAEEWWEALSPNFRVTTDAGEKRARQLAVQLEHIRSIFSIALPGAAPSQGRPLEVFAAKNDKTLLALLPQYADVDKRARPAGIFARTPDRNYIVMLANARGENPYGLVYHEYFHSLAMPKMPFAPLWVQEGMAGLWEQTVVKGDRVEMARPSETYLLLLRNQPLLPLEELLDATRSSEVYTDRHGQSMFYAQSWALVHYLVLGDPERRDNGNRLVDFLNAMSQGASREEASKQALGKVETLEDALRHYVRRFQFNARRMNAPPKPDEKQVPTRRLTPADSLARRGAYLAFSRQPAASEPYLAEALALAPDQSVAREALGFVSLLQGKKEQAEAEFKQAISKDSERQLAHFFLAMLSGERKDVDSLKTHLEASFALDGTHAPTLARLALLYRYEDAEKKTLALEMSRRAVSLAPDDALTQAVRGTAAAAFYFTDEAESAFKASLRFDPESVLAKQGMKQLQKLREHPMSGVWQYESYAVFLDIRAEGKSYQCRIDNEDNVMIAGGSLADGTIEWDQHWSPTRVSLDERGLLKVQDGALISRFERVLEMDSRCMGR